MNPHRNPDARCLLALALLAVAMPALALKSDRDKPMDVNADRFESNVKEGASVLTGNVRIVQGSLKIESERAEVHQDPAQQKVNRAVLNGEPARLEQDLDDGGHMVARAKQIDYDLAKETVVLTGNVIVEQPRGELRGEKVTYEIATGKLTGSGEGAASRVQMRLNPGTGEKSTDEKAK
jgi:lipopolysaccharide export system protein LptA